MSDPIPFRGFDEFGEVRIYKHGLLPHWRQGGCTYFVTFRLADALPQSVVGELEEEREIWLRAHGINPEAKDWGDAFARLGSAEKQDYEREIAARLNAELDKGFGSCVLRRRDAAEIVADGLEFFHGKRVLTGDYVVMPNHVHALLTPMSGFELEDILKSIKGFTAREINTLCGTEGKLWQKESYDHIVREFEQLGRYHRYIAGNPSKARLADGACPKRETVYGSGDF